MDLFTIAMHRSFGEVRDRGVLFPAVALLYFMVW